MIEGLIKIGNTTIDITACFQFGQTDRLAPPISAVINYHQNCLWP